MKKILILLFILSSLFLSLVSFAQAPVATGTPLIYKVTLNRFRISTDNGVTWTTIKDQAVEFDIASVTAGAAVGNFFAGAIDAGTYNALEHTVSATFKMQGYIIDAIGGTDYYTSTTAANGTNSTANFDVNNPPPDYGEASITVEGFNAGDNLPVTTETVNIVIEPGINRKVNIDFDVTNTLGLYNIGGGAYQLMPVQPTVTVSTE
jgi:hypothetical protein